MTAKGRERWSSGDVTWKTVPQRSGRNTKHSVHEYYAVTDNVLWQSVSQIVVSNSDCSLDLRLAVKVNSNVIIVR